MFFALWNKETDIASFLLEQGADINAKLSTTYLAPVGTFGMATTYYRYDFCEFLVKHGYEINESDKNGFTPLMDAVRKGNVNLVDLLIENGADVNAQSNNGDTPLKIAKREKNSDVVKTLKKAGVRGLLF